MKIEHNEPNNTCTHEYPIKNIKQNSEYNHGYALTIILENNTQITLTTDEMATIERIYNQIYYKQDLITKLNEQNYNADRLIAENKELFDKILEAYTDARYEYDGGGDICIPWYETIKYTIKDYEMQLQKYRTDIPAKGSTLYIPTINMQANAITSADIEKATVTNVETTHDGIEITANQRKYTANEIGTKIFIKETDAIAHFDKMCNFKARHRNIANHIAHTPIVIGEQITFAFQSELKNDINFMVQCHILKATINKNCTGYNITELGKKWLAWFK